MPCQPPEHCGAGNRELGTLTESILAHVHTERCWEQPGTCRGHPLPGTEKLFPPGTARGGNLTALYKYCGVWGHADRLFQLKVREAWPHMGTSKCQQSLLWKGESGTNINKDQGRGFPKWPSPATGSVGLGDALGAFPTAPIPWEGLGCPGTTAAPQPLLCQQCPGISTHTEATPGPCSHHISRVPSPAGLGCNSGATGAGPVAPVRGMVTGSVGSSLFHSRADESLDKNAARFWVDLF